jgi:hypothetical protein
MKLLKGFIYPRRIRPSAFQAAGTGEKRAVSELLNGYEKAIERRSGHQKITEECMV